MKESISVMDDVQSRPDGRGLAIDRAGVSGLRYPITVLDMEDGRQETVAQLSMSVSLPHHFKGTHMSRFIEVLNAHRGEVTMRTIPTILHELKERLEAETAHLQVKFPYFLERTAPVTKSKALMDYECTFTGESNGSKDDFILSVRVPVTSLCPCSKEISDYGAHNQRGYITIDIRSARAENGTPEIIWIEELIQIAESSASAPVYALIKRPDERFITMQAYDNPVFVEDMVRKAAEQLKNDSRISWYRVHAENDESIHNHNAFAEITSPAAMVV
jgi:GTP cyclohydrolase IB